MRFAFAMTVLLALLWSEAAPAQVTLTFQDGVAPSAGYAGTRDAMLYSQNGLCWNPTETCARSSLQLDGSPAEEAAFIRWDLSSIPTSATVTAASMSFYVTQGSTHAFNFYESLRPWNASQANWTQYSSGNAWQSAGSQGANDHAGTALGQLAQTGSGLSTTITLGAAGLALAQKWVSTPAQNHGLAFVDFATSDGLTLYSARAPTPSSRPRLSVTYTNGSTTTVAFQNGVAPTSAYAGETDVFIGDGADPVTKNYGSISTSNLFGNTDPYGLVMQFDLSAIPAWATVSSASLTLQVVNANPDSYPAYQLLRPWVESEVTWGRASSTLNWAALGAVGAGDSNTAVLATLDTGALGPSTAPFTAAGVQAVQGWVSGTQPNHGLLFQSYAANINSVSAIRTREDATPGLRPALQVTYVEGALVFTSVPSVVPPSMASGAIGVHRQSMAGASVASGAPALGLKVSAGSGELSSSAAGPWASILALTIPAGAADSPSFFYRNDVEGTDTLGAHASAAWTDGAATLTVGAAPLSVSPTTLSLVSGASQQLVVSGGAGGYQWSLSTAASGGSVNPTGLYLAGPRADSTDVVEVKDAAAASVTATVHVLAPADAGTAPIAERLRVVSGCTAAPEVDGVALCALALVVALGLRRQ